MLPRRSPPPWAPWSNPPTTLCTMLPVPRRSRGPPYDTKRHSRETSKPRIFASSNDSIAGQLRGHHRSTTWTETWTELSTGGHTAPSTRGTRGALADTATPVRPRSILESSTAVGHPRRDASTAGPGSLARHHRTVCSPGGVKSHRSSRAESANGYRSNLIGSWHERPHYGRWRRGYMQLRTTAHV
jgi:hypothetical protein